MDKIQFWFGVWIVFLASGWIIGNFGVWLGRPCAQKIKKDGANFRLIYRVFVCAFLLVGYGGFFIGNSLLGVAVRIPFSLFGWLDVWYQRISDNWEMAVAID